MSENIESFYLNLPPVLEKEVQNKYINRLFNGDDEARKEAREKLIIHNTRLVLYIAGKYKKSGAEFEELVSHGFIGLIKGIDTFAVNKKTKLSTYLARCIDNEILMFLRKWGSVASCISLETLRSYFHYDRLYNTDFELGETVLIENGFEEELVEKIFFDCDFHKLFNKLSVNERKIIFWRFGLFGERIVTQKEIGEVLNLSQSYVSIIEKRILKKWREELLCLKEEYVNHQTFYVKNRKN